jgi:hypothetical protein
VSRVLGACQDNVRIMLGACRERVQSAYWICRERVCSMVHEPTMHGWQSGNGALMSDRFESGCDTSPIPT